MVRTVMVARCIALAIVVHGETQDACDSKLGQDAALLQLRSQHDGAKVLKTTSNASSCPCIPRDQIDDSGEPDYPTYKKCAAGEVDYPYSVGTSCEKWDLTADPGCDGATDGWCNDPWCYVDPCTCETMAKKSSYFPSLKTVGGKPLYYSYATCGVDAETFTCSAADETKRACPCNKDETSCGGASGCTWHNSQCLGSDLVGCDATAAVEEAVVEEETIDSDASCPCIPLDEIDDSEEPDYPRYKKCATDEVDYPWTVGTSCKAWDLTADPGCEGATDGWCNDAWCYVDPCTCETMAKKSSYFPSMKTKGGKPLYYSYTTCGVDAESFTCSAADESKRACPCNKDETSCGGASGCTWHNSKCLGSDLVGC